MGKKRDITFSVIVKDNTPYNKLYVFKSGKSPTCHNRRLPLCQMLTIFDFQQSMFNFFKKVLTPANIEMNAEGVNPTLQLHHRHGTLRYA